MGVCSSTNNEKKGINSIPNSDTNNSNYKNNFINSNTIKSKDKLKSSIKNKQNESINSNCKFEKLLSFNNLIISQELLNNPFKPR